MDNSQNAQPLGQVMVTSYPVQTRAWSPRHTGSSLSSDYDSEALWQVTGLFQQFSPLHLSHPQVFLPAGHKLEFPTTNVNVSEWQERSHSTAP